jgi:hypothetical protein
VTREEVVFRKLDAILPEGMTRCGKRISVVLSGGARGADKLGEAWANKVGLPIEVRLAKWDELGKRAGYIRNREMARDADVVVVFWDGESKGTKHMIDAALDYCQELWVFKVS